MPADLVPVEQVDRMLFIDLFSIPRMRRERVDSGEEDARVEIQAIARHRLAAIAAKEASDLDGKRPLTVVDLCLYERVARRDARREALEEAAKVAEAVTASTHPFASAMDAAAAIRAKKDQTHAD